MKKFIAVIMTLCMMASALCVPVFAVPDLFKEVVISVRALKEDDTFEVIDEYSELDDGWNAAMDIAGSSSEMEDNNYDRIVVDLWVDWTADDGWFTDDILQGDGFKWRTIYIPADARVTLNMNGHTIDRGLTCDEADGSVIYIAENADVIINDGTFTGGWSDNGAGGIHICEKANVILNNVNVDDNSVTADDGAGIAVYDKATLIMNGGSISNNFLGAYAGLFNIKIHSYGALYVSDATVILNKVTVSDNNTIDGSAQGVAIYAEDSTVTMNECIVSGNAAALESHRNADSVIAAYDSKITITNTDFTNNAASNVEYGSENARLFYLEDSRLTMKVGKITGNNADTLFEMEDSVADIQRVTITDNASRVISVNNDSQKVNMAGCILGNNAPDTTIPEILVETKGTLAMIECKLGDSTFNNKEYIIFGNGTPGKAMYASIFGEGSLTMIVAFLALVISVAGMGVTLSLKKKLVHTTVNNAETDD